MNAQERWQRTWEHLGIAPPPGLLDVLLSAYNEPHRAYHNLQHLFECFDRLDSCPVHASDPATVELALWFHDAIYDLKATDNEAQSAALAKQALSALKPSQLDRIESLILATEHNREPWDSDHGLLVDVDLSILGAPAARFDEYEAQIRQEFAWVPEPDYRVGRSAVLRSFAERPQLFHTPHFRDLLESKARINLQRSLENLSTSHA